MTTNINGNKDMLIDFDYRGRLCNVADASANTGIHHFLAMKGLHDGSLVTLNNRTKTFHSTDVSGIAYNKMPLDTAMAQAQASILSQQGMRLPTNAVDHHREVLVSSYALSSSICVIQRGEEYDWVTKSKEVVSALFHELIPSVRKKGLHYFDDRFDTSIEELKSGQFKAVRVIPTDEGYQLGKVTLGSRNAKHVLPYYSVNYYANYVRHLLSTCKVELTYSYQGTVHKLITTLEPDVLAKWLGGSYSDAALASVLDWHSPLSFGYFNLPDLLNEGQFVYVPLLHILRIKPYV